MRYIGNQPSGQGQAERFIFTCTGTTPTITHDNAGVPIGYTVGQVSVYLNGVKQVVGTDVTATNGSSVVFAANLAVSDVVEVIALSTFAASNTVPATGGTFSGNVIHSGTVTNSSTTTATGLITANGGIETDTNSIIKDKGRCMQHSTHQAMVLGG